MKDFREYYAETEDAETEASSDHEPTPEEKQFLTDVEALYKSYYDLTMKPDYNIKSLLSKMDTEKYQNLFQDLFTKSR